MRKRTIIKGFYYLNPKIHWYKKALFEVQHTTQKTEAMIRVNLPTFQQLINDATLLNDQTLIYHVN